MTGKPAVSLVAVAGRRRATLELAARLERERFAGIYCPSPGDGLALCEALAPITLATLRGRMVELAGEIARGAVWANGARSHMAVSLDRLPAPARTDPSFFIGDMVPTCIDDDRAAAAAVMRKTLVSYVRLPNYQNYWIEAGYEAEMLAIRRAIAAGETGRIPELMSDRWLRDVTLFGSAAEVREGVEAWLAAGVRTVIVVPSSTRGGQMVAFDELITGFR